jgi:hypothetical protein
MAARHHAVKAAAVEGMREAAVETAPATHSETVESAEAVKAGESVVKPAAMKCPSVEASAVKPAAAVKMRRFGGTRRAADRDANGQGRCEKSGFDGHGPLLEAGGLRKARGALPRRNAGSRKNAPDRILKNLLQSSKLSK